MTQKLIKEAVNFLDEFARLEQEKTKIINEMTPKYYTIEVKND
jgi:hypothetical protein